MDLYPAIDLRDGRCVRLYQGDYGKETVYGEDPVAQARAFEDAGAPWIHVVDLDAARSGTPVNRQVVSAVSAAVGVPVQTGGGVRTVDDAMALDRAGVTRVVIGTAAIENPSIVSEIAARQPVAVGLDVRGTEVAVRGWEQGSGRQILDVLSELEGAGASAIVVTQIAVDGTLGGPDFEGLAAVLDATKIDVIASGGVGTLDHLRALRDVQVAGRRFAGVIVGRALYEGTFTISEALAACSAPAEPPG